MTMGKHTPGPWAGWFRRSETASEPPSCGRVAGPPWIDCKDASGYTNEADVMLIAKAPELLEENTRLRHERSELERCVLSWLGSVESRLRPAEVGALQDIVASGNAKN